MSPLVVLGDDDRGFLEESTSVVRDGLGRYWVAQLDGPKVFAPDGTFLHRVGNAGQGPGEFGAVTWQGVDENGSVHVFDADNLRVTSFDHNLEILGSAATPGPVSRAVLLARGRYLANMYVPTESAIGHPLHTVELDEARITSSFGQSPTGGAVMSFYRLATSDSGLIYTGSIDDYAIQIWTEDGHSKGCLVRPGLWEPRPTGQQQVSVPGEMPTLYGMIAGIHVDRAERVWVSSWIPKANWRDNLIRVERPDGPPFYTWRSPGTVYRNIIEVVDPTSGVIIAKRELTEPYVTGFLDDTTAYGFFESPSGAPRVAVVNITLHQRK